MSLQNSRDVSSLQVTMNGSQIEIDPFGNGTNPIDDVKVLLLKGQDGGVIDQQQSDWDQTDTSAVDYIKNKPNYAGSTSAGGAANSVRSILSVSDGNTAVIMFNGSATKYIRMRNKIVSVPASGWSSVIDSDGFYTNTVSLGAKYNTYVSPIISCTGSDRNSLPTSAQKSAFNLCDVFYFADGKDVESMTVKAKTKPTESFYVMINGMHFE